MPTLLLYFSLTQQVIFGLVLCVLAAVGLLAAFFFGLHQGAALPLGDSAPPAPRHATRWQQFTVAFWKLQRDWNDWPLVALGIWVFLGAPVWVQHLTGADRAIGFSAEYLHVPATALLLFLCPGLAAWNMFRLQFHEWFKDLRDCLVDDMPSSDRNPARWPNGALRLQQETDRQYHLRQTQIWRRIKLSLGIYFAYYFAFLFLEVALLVIA